MTAAAVAAAFSLVVAASFAGGLLSFPADRDQAALAEDLVAFHRAGEMALNRESAAAYDPGAFRAGLADHQKGLLWLNPPHAYFVMAPIAMLPYGAAKALWMALSIAALVGVLATARLKSRPFFALALFSPAMAISLMLLQLGGFIAVGLAAALVVAEKRPALAGIILALLTMKPQYGLMAPIFLIALGQWRAIFFAAASTALLTAASVLVFGAESWAAFAEALKTVHGPFARQALEGTATFSQTAAKLGAGDAARITAQGAGIALCAATTWFAARRLSRSDAIALTLLLSLAAAPSAWIYDWPLVIAALAFLAARSRWPVPVQAAAGLLWFAPLVPTFSDGLFAGVAPALALCAAALAIAAWLVSERQSAA
jgi:hypothetical protein